MLSSCGGWILIIDLHKLKIAMWVNLWCSSSLWVHGNTAFSKCFLVGLSFAHFWFGIIWPTDILQQLKRKGGLEKNEVDRGDWTSSPGFIHVVGSPLQTPVSAKGGRTYNRSKGTKGNRSTPQTPVSNVGKYFTISKVSCFLLTFFNGVSYPYFVFLTKFSPLDCKSIGKLHCWKSIPLKFNL